jgi:hypothetical protein
MADFHWAWTNSVNLVKLALISHEPIAMLVLAWMTSVPLYLILQTWFGFAWAGGWRIAALVPLVGLVVILIIEVIGPWYYPEQFGPPPENLSERLLFPPAMAVLLFSPVGFVYLAVVGLTRLLLGRPSAT